MAGGYPKKVQRMWTFPNSAQAETVYLQLRESVKYGDVQMAQTQGGGYIVTADERKVTQRKTV